MLASPLAVVPSPAYDPAPDDEQEDLGFELRRLRKAIRFSQMEVAFLCKVDVSTISRWERGRHQHTHTSKDRTILQALQVLRWAVQLQEIEPGRLWTLEEVLEELRAREKKRKRSR